MDSCGYSKLFNKWGTPGAGSIGGAVGGPQSTMYFEQPGGGDRNIHNISKGLCWVIPPYSNCYHKG